MHPHTKDTQKRNEPRTDQKQFLMTCSIVRPAFFFLGLGYYLVATLTSNAKAIYRNPAGDKGVEQQRHVRGSKPAPHKIAKNVDCGCAVSGVAPFSLALVKQLIFSSSSNLFE